MRTMTVAEAAADLGLAPKTVARQIRLGKLRAAKHGREWLVTQADVDAYRAASLGKPGRRPA